MDQRERESLNAAARIAHAHAGRQAATLGALLEELAALLAESRRLRARAARRRSEADGAVVIATDPTGSVTYWNLAAEILSGWSAAEAMGRAMTDLLVAPQDRRLAEAIVACVRRTGGWDGPFDIRHRDGATLPVQLRCAAIRDREGRVVRLLGISVPV